MSLKYVVYGAGKRGKDALELLGKENIYAFVDSDKEKVGTIYCDLPVMDINALKELGEDYLCIVSPLKEADEIMLHLEECGIRSYIKWQTVDLVLKSCVDKVYSKLRNIGTSNKIAICDISVSSLFLYNYFTGLGKNPIILVTNKEDLLKYSYLESYFNLELYESEIEECDVVIYMESNMEDNIIQEINDRKKCINIKELCEDCFVANEQIQKYKDIHLGDRCFIVATGPSLRVEDLELLEKNNEICISMNRIYNIFGKTGWRPNYYMIQDLKMIDDLKETIAELDLPVKFVSGVSEAYWKQKESASSIKFNYLNLVEMGKIPFFSTQVDKCIYEGMTVTYACLQMAVYMGFKEIYLLGLDHNYSNDLYAGSNHFAGYDTDKRIRLNTVHIGQNELAYISAKKYAEQNGIKIYNTTRGGKLEVFERKDFDSLFDNSSK